MYVTRPSMHSSISTESLLLARVLYQQFEMSHSFKLCQHEICSDAKFILNSDSKASSENSLFFTKL